ncbi:class I SAM-dependent methyltransferase [Polaribacter aestuariivivens]|uniref:Class I SAM-dependent methyltransferase n=1 Tax=Polaribacter aestuariivivens TaxID=2304626 RepID=A0A5S3N9Z8_9FLAO|nr:class I SAM-dependent methyltransferase [Polaribacter aestuariivivens]TMM31354.1 class I SAM-dependent methyltransferase [Polaribacter aestuariivivens]
MAKDFFYTKLTTKNLDNFFIRTSIKNAIETNLNDFKGKLLDAGCGKMPYKSFILKNSNVKNYVGLDIEEALVYDEQIKPDYFWDGKTMPFKANSFDTILSTEVLEHCYDYKNYIKECLRVLKPEGIIFFTVPFLWPLHETPHDHYRFTPFTLQKAFEENNNCKVNIYGLGGWNASLATMLGLWTTRYVSKKKSKLIKPFLKPIIKYLIAKDKAPKKFENNTMYTSLCGIVKKNNE